MPTKIPLITRTLPLLLACVTAAAQELRDSGYGDESLIDPSGQYYYLQPNGNYMDVYGSTFSPIGDGFYTDALGNLLDAGPQAATLTPTDAAVPETERDADADADTRTNRTPGRGRYASPRGLPNADNAGAVLTDPPPRGTAKRKDSGGIGSRYLDDVGDGYLKIDPGELAADPRLAEPEGARAKAEKKAGKPRAAKEVDITNPDLRFDADRDASAAPNAGQDAAPDDLPPIAPRARAPVR